MKRENKKSDQLKITAKEKKLMNFIEKSKKNIPANYILSSNSRNNIINYTRNDAVYTYGIK